MTGQIRLKINQQPALRCKVLPGFAGSVAATSPIVVTPGGGVYTVSLNLTALIASLASTYPPIDADLTAIGNLTGTGILARTAADTWAQRTLTAPAAGLTITDPAGIAGNPTFVLANDLAAVEGLAATGMAARTASDTWTVRVITGTANEITLTNGDGVGGNPTASLPIALTFTGKTITGGTYSGPSLSGVVALGRASAAYSSTTAGDSEYDGKAFAHIPNSSNRGIAPSVHLMIQASDQAGTNVSTAQTWFPGGGATQITLPSATSYYFEGSLTLARSAGTTSHDITVLFAGAAVIGALGAVCEGSTATGNSLADVRKIRLDSAAGAACTVASAVATENNIIWVTGVVRVTTAGTFIPQFKYSAAPGGAPTVKALSTWFRMYPIGSDSVGSVGNWS